MSLIAEHFMLWRRIAPAVALLLLTVVVYAPAAKGSFLWDDDTYITANKTLTSAEGLGKIWFEPGATPQYYPLVFTTFWIEYHLWELNPSGYLIVNLLLHGVNAILLWLILRRLAVPGAWLAAALFAVHPVYVESIAWIQERKNLLSGLFFFAAVLAYLRFARIGAAVKDAKADSAASAAVTTSFYLVALILGVCAFLSKTATCALPAALALLIWWKRGRLARRDLAALVPLFALSVASGLMTVWVEWRILGVGGADWSFTAIERTLIAGRALWFYAWKLIWPVNLAFIYPRWQIDASAWWQYVFPLAAMGVIAALWLLRGRIGKGPLVAALFFAGMLLPTLGFINFYFMRLSFVADHLVYIPSVSLLALAAALLVTGLRRFAPWLWVTPCTLARVAALITLAVLTSDQERHFKDPESLYADTLAKNPECWLAHNNLGNVLARQGDYRRATDHFRKALLIRPDYPKAHYALAKQLLRFKDFKSAKEHMREALRLEPTGTDAQLWLGYICKQQEQFDEAAAYLTAYLSGETQTHEQAALAFYTLGMVRAQQKDWSAARADLEQACALRPDAADGHRALAEVLRQMGMVAEADAHQSEAGRLGGR